MDKRLIELGRHVTAGVVAGAVLAWAPAAWAQAKPAPAKPAAGAAAPAAKPEGTEPGGGKADLAAAKKHYAEGDKKFKAGDFAGALVEFKAANEIKATPQVERYLGMCEDSLGHFAAAVDWYEKFLAHVPEKLKDQGDEIKKRTADIKALPGKVHIESTPAGASVTVDDKPQASPAPLDIELPVGSHKVGLTAPGHVAVVEVHRRHLRERADRERHARPRGRAAARRRRLPSRLRRRPQAAPPPPPPPEPRSKVPAYITGGLAVVAAGIGTAFGVIALGDKSDYDKNPTSSTADNGDTHALIADMSFGVAITFGVTSAVLFLTKDEPPPAAASTDPQKRTARTADARPSGFKVTPTPIVGPHSGGAGFVVQF